MWDFQDVDSSITSHTGSALEHSYDGVNSAPIEVLKHLVSTASCIQAELLRLGQTLPEAVLRPHVSHFAPVLPGFAHLHAAHVVNDEINSDRVLLALDEDFQEKHGLSVRSVYTVLESILQYHANLQGFLADLEGRTFLQSSLEGVLLGLEGKQLMVEAVAGLSAILLVLDELITSDARERAVVAYYRMQGGMQAVGDKFNSIVSLSKATGMTPGKPWPSDYPVRYLQRLPIPWQVVRTIINKMRSEDIYAHISHFPSSEHRSAALARQASQLYLLLYYDPELLQKDSAVMRELVDKHFADNWVVCWAPGFLAHLPVRWSGFKAAASALNSIISPSTATVLATSSQASMQTLLVEVQDLLREGALSDEYLLQNVGSVFGTLRSANVVIRWLILHRTTARGRLLSAMALHPSHDEDLLSLLLHTADLEHQVKKLYQDLLTSAPERWAWCQQRAVSSLEELANFFSGQQPLCRDMADPRLSSMFSDLAAGAAQLSPMTGRTTIKKVRHLMALLDDLEGRHSVITSSLHTRHHTTTARSLLSNILCIANVRKEMLVTFSVITDFAYGWGCVRAFLPQLHRRIRQQSKFIGAVGSLFVKLATLMELPWARVQGAKQVQVLTFYSTELDLFMQAVLRVVPASLFRAVEQVVELQSRGMLAIPDSLPRSKLAEYAQLPQRQCLAQLTYTISAFTQGLVTMDHALADIETLPMPLAPLTWVQGGIRSHLIKCLTSVCDRTLLFSRRCPRFLTALELPPNRSRLNQVWAAPLFISPGDSRDAPVLPHVLSALRAKMLPLSQGLEYLQDYLSIASLTMWQQAHGEIWRAALQTEVAALNREHSRLMESKVPMAVGGGVTPAAGGMPHITPASLDDNELWVGHAPRDGPFPQTFLGRLLAELLRLSDPLITDYSIGASGWLPRGQTGPTLLGEGTLAQVREAVAVDGLRALDGLLCLRVHLAISDVFRAATYTLASLPPRIADAVRGLEDHALGCRPDNAPPWATILDRVSSRAALHAWGPLIQVLAMIGQSQLLRRHLATHLSACARATTASPLEEVLQSYDTATLAEHFSALQPSEDARAARQGQAEDVREAAATAAAAGHGDPVHQTLSSAMPAPGIASALTSVLLCIAAYAARTPSAISCLSSEAMADRAALVAGIASVLTHSPPETVRVMLQQIACVVEWQMCEEASTREMAALCFEPVEVGWPRGVATLLDVTASVASYNARWQRQLQEHVPLLAWSSWRMCAEGA